MPLTRSPPKNDVSKYAAYFVVALNHDMSVSSIIDPIKKIEALLASRK